MTTQVVAITSSRLGHVTCFISTRTSCRNSRVFDRASNFFADAGRCSGDGAALRFFVLHCDRLRGHESSFSPVGQTFLSVLFTDVRPANAKTLAGEEGFEPPYPVLETGVLAVGRLP